MALIGGQFDLIKFARAASLQEIKDNLGGLQDGEPVIDLSTGKLYFKLGSTLYEVTTSVVV